MSTKFINIIIVIIFISILSMYYFNQKSDDNKKIKMDKSTNLITVFDENTQFYSDDFIDQFNINSNLNELWLGILIKKNNIYELHHFTLPVGEDSVNYDFDITNVSEVYICSEHIDHFVGKIEGSSTKTNINQFQIYTDTSLYENDEITGSYFKGIIDVYEVDLNIVTDEIIYRYYAGSIDNTPIQTWHFSLKNE